MKDKLTAHFKRHEFECHCGCGRDTVDFDLISLCETVREINGGPVRVLSGHRCPRSNAIVKGAPDSQHLYGRAADLLVRDPRRVYSELCRIFPRGYGFGLYPHFVHVDTRTGQPARWVDPAVTKEGGISK
jgi:uncharacterized protein YcbK (DUF882 family)